MVSPLYPISDGTPYSVPDISPDMLSGTTMKVESHTGVTKIQAWIFDSFGNFVTDLTTQENSFISGSNGETTCYLYWNLAGDRNINVATGVYTWKIIVLHSDGSTEKFIVKTGVLR